MIVQSQFNHSGKNYGLQENETVERNLMKSESDGENPPAEHLI